MTLRKNSSRQTKNKRLLVILLMCSLLMFGFGFLLVPFYDVMCNVLGLNGRASLEAAKPNTQAVDLSRIVTVNFIASKNASLPIEFYPTTVNNDKRYHQLESATMDVSIHPGENKRIAFYVKNDTMNAITMQAIPSVSPGEAANYVRKTECFCFESQHLLPGQSMLMPVIFHLDPELPKKIHSITLLYTAFNASDKPVISSKVKGRIS